jgi:hypothetical protein
MENDILTKLAIESILLYQDNQYSETQEKLIELYYAVKHDPESMKMVTDNASFGKAFLMMLENKITDDEDNLQMIASISYIFLSKAIEADKNNVDFLKTRLRLLKIGNDSLIYTVMKTLSFGSVGVASMGLFNEDFKARDAIFMMEIADLETNPNLCDLSDLLYQRRNRFRQMIAERFFGVNQTIESIVQKGQQNHQNLIQYLDERVIQRADIDF